MRHAYLLTAALACGGCAHSLHEVHASDITPGTSLAKGVEISSTKEQFVVLGCVGNTNYVEAARTALLGQCPAGRIEGITTQYSTDLGFLSWTNHILMKGVCIAGL